MVILGNFYLGLYFLYVIFGYNIWTQILTRKPIEYINNNKPTSAYWLRRLTKLSQNSLLLSAYYLYYPTFTLYISVVFVHCVILTGYYLKWGFYDPICYISHILSGIPVCLQISPIENLDYTTMSIILNILIVYYFAQNIIYTE